MREWKYEMIDISRIEEAKENANKMSDSDFAQLVDNIRVGGLSSSPTLWHRKADDMYVIISGHHRIMACRKLAYTKVGCLYAEEDDLSEDEKIATQISHNSLHGEDNKGILKRMFEEIKSVDFKQFAHINIDEIESIPMFQGSVLPESEHYNVSFILYKKDIEALKELFGIVQEDLTKSEMVIMADQDNSEELLQNTIRDIQKKYNVKSSNIAFCKILELAQLKMKEEKNNG